MSLLLGPSPSPSALRPALLRGWRPGRPAAHRDPRPDTRPDTRPLGGLLGLSSRRAAVTAALTYALLLAGSGVYQPFFPVWLGARGFGPEAIGFLLSLPMVMRLLATMPLSRVGDGRLGPRRTLLVMACASALGYAGLYFCHGLLAVALVLSLTTACLAPTSPLLDVIVLDGVARHGHDYGRIRQWGSIAWLAASLAMGSALGLLPIAAIPPVLAGLSALTALVGLSLPDDRRAGLPPLPERSAAARGPEPGALAFGLLCATIACLQGAHAFLYGFGTIVWQAHGFSGLTIGVLWGMGVAFETLMFLAGRGLAERLGPYGMIALGGGAGLLRWSVMGFDPSSAAAIAALQGLHGLSFAAVHLGTMRWLGRFRRRRAFRQGVANAAIGAGYAAGTLASGPLYSSLGVHGYFVMLAVAVAGLGLAAATRAVERRQAAPAT